MKLGLRPLYKSTLHRIVVHRDHRKVHLTATNLRRWRRTEVTALVRRGKKLGIATAHGTLVVGAGMSGHWRWMPATAPFVPQKHDTLALKL